MSVKLVIAALVMTVVVAAPESPPADDKMILTVKTCTGSSDCSCSADEDNTKKYTVGVCAKQDGMGDLFWKADTCVVGQTQFALKGYDAAGCAEKPKKKVPTACTAIEDSTKFKVECVSSGRAEVRLSVGCTGKCDQDDATCSTIPFFFDDVGTEAGCKEIDGKYYKLKKAACPTEDYPDVILIEYAQSGCSGTGKEVTTSRFCKPTYYKKATCTPAAADDAGKATIESCRFGCNACDTTEVPLKEYKRVGEETLYLESCPASNEDGISFEVYSNVKTYSKTCAGGTSATCEEPPTTTETSTTTTTAANNDTTTSTFCVS